MTIFEERFQRIKSEKERLTETPNKKLASGDGFCERYKFPVLTAATRAAFLGIRPRSRQQSVFHETVWDQRSF